MTRFLAMIATLCMMSMPAASNTLTLTGDDAYPPYSRADLPGQGFLNVLVAEIFKEAGYEPAIELLPWSRALAATESADKDVLIGAFYTEDRAKIYEYSEPFYSAETILLAKSDYPVSTYSDFSDLSGAKVGIIQDNAYPGGILDADLDFEAVTDFNLNLRKLDGGRIDLVVDLTERLRYAAENTGLDWSQFKALEPALGAGVMHITVSKSHTDAEEIISRFNEALASMRESGRYDEILTETGYGQ